MQYACELIPQNRTYFHIIYSTYCTYACELIPQNRTYLQIIYIPVHVEMGCLCIDRIHHHKLQKQILGNSFHPWTNKP